MASLCLQVKEMVLQSWTINQNLFNSELKPIKKLYVFFQ